MPTAFTGSLNVNEIFGSIYNMIISQTVIEPSLANNYSALVSKYKVDGSLYGDQKLFYDQDVLASRDWLNDAEAANLLNINRPADPKCQTIVLNQFRQIDVTTDQYLSKRAWSTEGVFSTFNSIVMNMVSKTKELFETTMFNVFVGTTEGNATKSTLEIPLSDITETGEEGNRLKGAMIARYIADLLVDMKDYSRDYNDYGFMRAYTEGQLNFIWNAKYINMIQKEVLPTIFHKEGLVDKLGQYVLPARYFGEIVTGIAADTDHFTTSDGTSVVKTGVTTVHTAVEADFGNGSLTKHLFPGDTIPAGYIVKSASVDYTGSIYVEDSDIICKVVTNDTYKMMSAFEVGTNFFNPRSLTTNHYLTWGYSTPQYLAGQPLVTIHED